MMEGVLLHDLEPELGKRYELEVWAWPERHSHEKFVRVPLLTIDGLLDNTRRAERLDYEPEWKAGMALISKKRRRP